MPTVYQSKDRNGKPHPRWRFKYVDRLGVRRTGTGSTSKRETWELAMRVQAQQDEIRKGWAPTPKLSDQPYPIGGAVADYLAWGAAQGGHHDRPWSKKHARARRWQLAFWVRRLRLESVADLYGTLAEVEKALQEKLATGVAGTTLGYYRNSICALCRWLLERDRLTEHPLRRLRGFDLTPKRIRRALTVSEFQTLLRVSSPEHRLTYLVAGTTGLRKSELRALRRRHLDLIHKGLLLEAAWTKNNRANFQPLPSAVFDLLEEASRVCGPDDPILHVHSRAARMIRQDLVKAGIPWETDEGIADFHSLRVTYTTLVIEVGASVKEAQTLARHSSPDLTMNIYARTRSARLTEVAEKVGGVIAPAETCPADVQRDGAPSSETAATPEAEKGCGAEEGAGSAESRSAEVPGETRTLRTSTSAQPGQTSSVTLDVPFETRTALDYSGWSPGQTNCLASVHQDLRGPATGFACGFIGFGSDVPRPAQLAEDFSGYSGYSGMSEVA